MLANRMIIPASVVIGWLVETVGRVGDYPLHVEASDDAFKISTVPIDVPLIKRGYPVDEASVN